MRRLEQDISAAACTGSQVQPHPREAVVHVIYDHSERRFTVANDVCYLGAKCEVDIDECDSAPCQNGGLCKDGMGGFQCQCKPGFLGD